MTFDEFLSCEPHTRVRVLHDIGIDFGTHKDELILINGALCTEAMFENFDESFAHIFRDGLIRRYGVVVGDISCLEKL